MATTFGNRPEDVVADSRGNVLSGVVLQIYPTEADANAGTALIASATTDDGYWLYEDASDRDLLWVRDPAGRVWPIGSEEALGEIANKADAAATTAALATKPALDGLPVDGSNATGVDKTGVTDSAAAIQAVLDANAQVSDTGAQKVVRLQGIFNLGTTGIVVRGSLDAANAVFNYSGTGVAVQIGNSAAGQLTRINVKLGQILLTNKPAGASWTAGTVGLKVTNIFRSTISYQYVKDFETGLLLAGDGTYGQGGVAYNTFHCGTLNNNLVNQSLQLIAGGTTPFVNQNVFIGGSWSHSDGTYPQAGMRQVLIGTAGGGSLNNNLWVNCSLEGQREEYILDVYGNDNMWLNCRWEFSGANPPTRWRATAARNTVIGGYQVNELLAGQVIDSGAVANNIIGSNGWEVATTTDGGIVTSPYSGGTTAGVTVMRGDWRRLGDTTAAGYLTKILGGILKLKAVGDTSDRFKVDYSTRTVTLGAGVSASAATISWGSGSPEGVTTANQGSTYYNYGAGSTGFGQYLKASGTGNTGWHAVGFQPFTTAARPTAALAGIGGHYYDTTLSKPGFSDGTAWRDAAGTAI